MKSIPAAAALALSVVAAELTATSASNATDTNATTGLPSHAATRESAASVQATCAGSVVGVDLPGNDLYSVRSSQPNPCWVYCDTNDTCKAWTWTNFNGGTCWLKSGHGSAVFRAGAVSGAVYECTSPARYLVIENCDARGNDLNSRPGTSYWDCTAADAVSFTWSDYGGGTCWYKTTASGCEYAPNKFTGVRLT